MTYVIISKQKRGVFLETEEKIMGLTIKRSYNLTKIYQDNELIYYFEGICKIARLDCQTIIIAEKKEDSNYLAMVLISIFKNNIRINRFPIPENDSIKLRGLEEIKKIIVPFKKRHALYSYDLEVISSAAYDTIIYNEETKEFTVIYVVNTPYKNLELYGKLNQDGHLINDLLYSPLLKRTFYVDEHQLDASIAKYQKKFNKLMRMERIKEEEYRYYAWESDQILKRKKGNR